MLMGAVPAPYHSGYGKLPATIKEIQTLDTVLPAGAQIPVPDEDNCLLDPVSGLSVQTVQDLLPQASILHLSCHGTQDRKDPLDSGFVLRDGKLKVVDIMKIPLPKAFFAFLSACETAQGDRGQPDQAIHLAATMLFAGFKSVLATMW